MSSAADQLETHLSLFPDAVSPLRERAGATVRGLSIVAAATGLLLIIGAIAGDDRQFYHSYLFGYLFVLQMSLGSLFWVLIHHVSDAGWSAGLRRIHENVTRSIPALAILFVPILIGIYTGDLHDWYRFISQPEPTEDHVLHQWHVKHLYYSAPFFIARIAIYFAVWIAYAVILRRWSERQDETGGSSLSLKMQSWAPSGLLLLGITTTFFAFDVLMSLQYTWFSTIFGVYFWIGGIRSSLCFAVLTVLVMWSRGYLRRTITIEHLHEAAKLLFGLTVFWAYIAFSQYFLIWYGNMPEETQFYLLRRNGTWYEASILLPIISFAIPFFLLLPRSHKRNPLMLALSAGWILFAQAFDMYWQVLPVLHRETIHVHWLDIIAPVFMLATILTMTFRGMQRSYLIPIRDVRLNESIGYQNETP
jgi:hypothetical protein